MPVFLWKLSRCELFFRAFLQVLVLDLDVAVHIDGRAGLSVFLQECASFLFLLPDEINVDRLVSLDHIRRDRERIVRDLDHSAPDRVRVLSSSVSDDEDSGIQCRDKRLVSGEYRDNPLLGRDGNGFDTGDVEDFAGNGGEEEVHVENYGLTNGGLFRRHPHPATAGGI